MLRLLLASEDGYLYVYSLDVGEGGDCALIRQFHLSSKDVETTEAVKMEQQQLEATHSDQADQVDQGSNLDKKLTESKINLIDSCFFNYTFFLVDISYADRLKNRHPSDQMTGNNPSNFNFLQQKKNPLHFALLKGVGTAFSHYEKKNILSWNLNETVQRPKSIRYVNFIPIPSISDSEKFHEMAAATESPPQQCFLLDDDGEFPPMNKA